jgi:hypothetical protein
MNIDVKQQTSVPSDEALKTELPQLEAIVNGMKLLMLLCLKASVNVLMLILICFFASHFNWY